MAAHHTVRYRYLTAESKKRSYRMNNIWGFASIAFTEAHALYQTWRGEYGIVRNMNKHNAITVTF